MNTKYKQFTTAVQDAIEIDPFNEISSLVLGTTRVGKTRLAELFSQYIIHDSRGDLDLFKMVSK